MRDRQNKKLMKEDESIRHRSRVILAILLALALGPGAPVSAQEPTEAQLTINSVTLEDGEIVVSGTLTCAEVVTGQVYAGVYQLDEEALGASGSGGAQDITCRPGEATTYQLRVSSQDRPFSGGRFQVEATFEYGCGDNSPCRTVTTTGIFDVEGPPPAPTIAKTLRLTVYGTPGPDDARRALDTRITGEGTGYAGAQLCVAPEEPCVGGGRVHTFTFPVLKGSAITVEWISYVNTGQGPYEPDIQTFGRVTETLSSDTTNEAWYDLDTNTGGLGAGPDIGDDQQEEKDTGEAQDDQQGGKPTAPDNQQTGTGKTQEDKQGAGKSPDSQQTGDRGDTATKTFELTLNGTVPEGETFAVRFGVADGDEGNADILHLCGEGAQDECAGGTTVYSGSIEVPAGTRIDFAFVRMATGEVFHEGTETIHDDMTNTAWYTFGNGAAAGDTQDELQDTDAGKIEDGQQDTDTGVSDGQQAELPVRLPETGAGGMAAGATLPVGNALGGLSVMLLVVWSLACKC